jgi:hypothetical protein
MSGWVIERATVLLATTGGRSIRTRGESDRWTIVHDHTTVD